jgi:hypothetical protein
MVRGAARLKRGTRSELKEFVLGDSFFDNFSVLSRVCRKTRVWKRNNGLLTGLGRLDRFGSCQEDLCRCMEQAAPMLLSLIPF